MFNHVKDAWKIYALLLIGASLFLFFYPSFLWDVLIEWPVPSFFIKLGFSGHGFVPGPSSLGLVFIILTYLVALYCIAKLIEWLSKKLVKTLVGGGQTDK